MAHSQMLCHSDYYQPIHTSALVALGFLADAIVVNPLIACLILKQPASSHVVSPFRLRPACAPQLIVGGLLQADSRTSC